MGRQAEDVAFASRFEFLECLAAFVALNWDECKRASPSSKSADGPLTIADVLAAYAAPGRVAWLFNLSSYLSNLSPQERLLLPCGTTSNEALHAEMRNTSRSVTKRHASNLELAMDCFSIGKLLAHQQSLLRPTLRGTRQVVVMARYFHQHEMWSTETWGKFCEETDEPCQKHCGPVGKLRYNIRNRAKSIARWLKKRPAGKRANNVKMFRQSRVLIRKPTVFDSTQRGYEKAK